MTKKTKPDINYATRADFENRPNGVIESILIIAAVAFVAASIIFAAFLI